MSGKWLIDRRTLLCGASAAVALPLLETMIPSTALAQNLPATPTRLCAIKFPLGYHPDSWAVTGSGSTYTPTAQLAKLVNENRADVTLVKGLHTHLNLTNDTQPGVPTANYFSFGVSHYQGTAGFLTCQPMQRGTTYPVHIGTQFDQVVANAIGSQTRFRSLVLRSVENGAGSDAGSGAAKAYRTNISFSDPSTPATSIDDPLTLFTRLFSNAAPTTDPAALRAQQLKVSVLDAVSADAKTLNARLGRSDQARLDEYLTNLAEVERRVKSTAVGMTCTPGQAPSGDYSYPNHVIDRMRAMLDLITLAFSCDLTRVVTYMLDEDFQPFDTAVLVPNTVTYPHALSHYDNSDGAAAAVKPEQFKAYNQFYFDEFSSWLNKVKVLQTPTGRLLDSMLVSYGSGIGDTMSHQGYDIPMVLAGKGNGALRPGRLVDVRTGAFAALEHVYPWDSSSPQRMKGRPVADLWLTFMKAMGVSATSFGNSTGPIAELA